MRSTTITAVARTAFLGLAVALVSAHEQEPTFRASTRLVEITVSVMDKKGVAVGGLEPSDFVVLDQGKPRQVALFHADAAWPAPAAVVPRPTLPSGTFTNRPMVEDGEPRNINALVLDNINTPARLGVAARAKIMRYLRVLAPRTLTAVYLMADKLYVLHEFTDDPASLRSKLANASLPDATGFEVDDTQAIMEAERFVRLFAPDPEARDVGINTATGFLRADQVETAALRHDRMRRSLAQIETLGAHLAVMPGRKNLVWVGGGLSMVSIAATTGGQRPTPEILESFEQEVRQAARRMAQQGIILYIVDANRLEASSDVRPQSPQPLPQRGRGNFELPLDTSTTSSDTKSAMQAMASITGGRYFYPDDQTSGVDKVQADSRASYTLGFYLSEKPDDKWHKLKVQVNRPGVTVRHREGYLADSRVSPAAEWTPEMWRAVLSNPVPSFAVPLTVACKATPSGELAITVLAETSALQFAPEGDAMQARLEVLIGDRTAEGPGHSSRYGMTSSVPMARWQAARQGETRYNGTWKPGADATGLRVIVHDVNSGRYGSIDVPLSRVSREVPASPVR